MTRAYFPVPSRHMGCPPGREFARLTTTGPGDSRPFGFYGRNWNEMQGMWASGLALATARIPHAFHQSVEATDDHYGIPPPVLARRGVDLAKGLEMSLWLLKVYVIYRWIRLTTRRYGLLYVLMKDRPRRAAVGRGSRQAAWGRAHGDSTGWNISTGEIVAMLDRERDRV